MLAALHLGPAIVLAALDHVDLVVRHRAVLGRFFARHCGSGSAHKHVPELLWTLPREYFLAYLEGQYGRASDREPLKPVLLYGLGAALLYLGLRLPLAPISAALMWITPALQGLIAAFLFVILLNVVVLALLFLIRQVLPL
jgi:hypothetical protein